LNAKEPELAEFGSAAVTDERGLFDARAPVSRRTVGGLSHPACDSRDEEDVLKAIVSGSWTGWSGDTIVKLTNGSVWEQAEYYYEYRYAYRPEVSINEGKMLVMAIPRLPSK